MLDIVKSSIVLRDKLGLRPQCPRERQEPRSAADGSQAGRLHTGRVRRQRDGGRMVGEVLGLKLVLVRKITGGGGRGTSGSEITLRV